MQSIRPLADNDIDQVINYFIHSDESFLMSMGVDPNKLPPRCEWRSIIAIDLVKPLEQKSLFYLIWEMDGQPVGHSNINKVVYGKEAYMHLHLWASRDRQQGLSHDFIKDSIAQYFEQFDLKQLVCEPFSLNPGPNRVLEKAGFKYLRTYNTTPGWINYPQSVNRWILTRKQWGDD